MNWPALHVDFQHIPNRVLKLYDKLQHIVFDNEACKALFVWNSFKADLETDGYTMAQFSRLQHVPISSAIWHNSRIGYYGLKGTAIIMHVLMQLFPPTTPTDAIQPLSLWQYLSYFVVPHIGCQLIAEDLSISMTMNAYNLMVQSMDQSNHRPRPKPRIILWPPKQVGESSSLGHEVNEDQDVGRASVLTSTGHGSVPQASRPQVPSKKPCGRWNKTAPVEAEVAGQDPGPVSTGQRTQRNARQK
ncbi:hypothetical protein EDD15DRAFT_2198368 [Pisolithus albus]|nr:hypothetical protein EDD15DRAFT_2198368 [Pisolithus albus]